MTAIETIPHIFYVSDETTDKPAQRFLHSKLAVRAGAIAVMGLTSTASLRQVLGHLLAVDWRSMLKLPTASEKKSC